MRFYTITFINGESYEFEVDEGSFEERDGWLYFVPESETEDAASLMFNKANILFVLPIDDDDEDELD